MHWLFELCSCYCDRTISKLAAKYILSALTLSWNKPEHNYVQLTVTLNISLNLYTTYYFWSNNFLSQTVIKTGCMSTIKTGRPSPN